MIVSPCISICKNNPLTGFCYGCGRSNEDKKKWKDIKTSDDWKKKNLIEIQGRLKKSQLEIFKESYKYKILNGVSTIKKMNKSDIENLNKKIINCNKCKRLVYFRKKISIEKRKQYKNETYWGKPITGFGDLNGKMLIIGLAPAAHGGTRTGRVFTGDKSSEFLYKCLYSAKISNQPYSININDGLRLYNAYITTALKCVPPGDKPEKKELYNCYNYLNQEINLLKNCKIIIALGKIAFDACVNFYKNKFNVKDKFTFIHGKNYKLPDGKILFGCYHPSPRNVNTGRINLKKMKSLLLKTKKYI